MDSKESIPPAYVAWRAGTTTLILLGSYSPLDCSEIPAQYSSLYTFFLSSRRWEAFLVYFQMSINHLGIFTIYVVIKEIFLKIH